MQGFTEDTTLVTTQKSGNRILIVDDEPDFTFTLKKGLEKDGFKVDSFNDPSEALSHLRSSIYDLAFIDVKMPRV